MFTQEVEYDARFAAYAAGMATTFVERLNTGRHLTPEEIDWLHKTTGHAVAEGIGLYEMCDELKTAHIVQQVITELDK